MTRPARHELGRAHETCVAGMTPAELRSRGDELAELSGFCAADAGCLWWQAEPWAGKTALLSWFTLHPPAGVEVVSFFVTSRFAGDSESAAFTVALLEQLGPLAGEPVSDLLLAPSPHGHVLRLLAEVAGKRRLVLVVDGLDEDTSASNGLPSIAALLPACPIPGLRIVVTSRTDLDLPDDVPGDHMLRSTEVRQLVPFIDAQPTELAARDELTRSLHGSQLQQDVLGLVTAAGGGLTPENLAELTDVPPVQVAGLFSRILRTGMASGSSGEQGFVFAHETLRATAERELGARMEFYRDRLHDWAAKYRNAGWPEETPAYLLRRYPRLLTEVKDIPRTLDLVLDRARLDRLDGHAFVLAEIAAATRMLAAEPKLDHVALVRLALARDLLTERGASIPLGLPAAWVALGHAERGVALAEAVPGATRRACAIARLAAALIRDGKLDRAVGLARAIPDGLERSLVQDAVVSALIAERDPKHAQEIARTIPDAGSRDWALCRVAASLIGSDPAAALDLAREIVSPRIKARALEALACQLNAAGQGQPHLLDEAGQAIRGIRGGRERDLALGELSRAHALTEDHSGAQQTIGRIGDVAIRTWFQAEVTGIIRVQGADLRDIRMPVAPGPMSIVDVYGIGNPYHRAEAMSELAARMVSPAGIELALAAERTARGTGTPATRSRRGLDLVTAMVETGDDLVAAGVVARSIPVGSTRMLAVERVVEALVRDDERAEAQTLARKVAGDDVQAIWASNVVGILSKARLPAEALAVAGRLVNRDERTETVLRLLSALEPEELAAYGDLVDGVQYELTESPKVRDDVVTSLVRLRITRGEPGQAHLFATAIQARFGRVAPGALAALTDRMHGASIHLDDAVALARQSSDPTDTIVALCAMAKSWTESWHSLVAEAESMAHALSDPADRVRALCEVARRLFVNGETHHARQVVGHAEASLARVTEADRAHAQRHLSGLRPYLRSRAYDADRRFEREALNRRRRGELGVVLDKEGPDAAADLLRDKIAASGRVDAYAVRRLLDEVLRAGMTPGFEHVLRPLIVQALGTADWSELLPGIARLTPQVLPVVLEALGSD